MVKVDDVIMVSRIIGFLNHLFDVGLMEMQRSMMQQISQLWILVYLVHWAIHIVSFLNNNFCPSLVWGLLGLPQDHVK